MVKAWTDGSCVNATGNKGGYGIVFKRGDEIRKFIGGSYMNTTSARMEILGIIRALNKAESGEHIEVFCDNQYAVNALDKKWIFKWAYEGWRSRKNADLWIEFLKEYNRLNGKVKLTWIRGHNGHTENELADQLANLGANREEKIIDKK